MYKDVDEEIYTSVALDTDSSERLNLIMENNESLNQDYNPYHEESSNCSAPCVPSKRLKVQCLEKVNNSKGALTVLCIAVFLQAISVNGFINVAISTIERRFHLRSSETGFIVSSYDIAICVPLLVVAYIGGRGHKPLWMAWGVFLISIGAFLFAMPHFLAPTYSGSQKSNNQTVCGENDANMCEESSLRNYRYLFILAQILNGIGSCPLFTLGVTYLDENVSQTQSSTYHGIFFACGTFGPAVGYGLGGAILHIYTNILEEVNFDATSMLWVGAWWIGLFFCSLLLFILSFPLSMFPKHLPNTKHLRVNREMEVHETKNYLSDAMVSKQLYETTRFRDIPKAGIKLFRNSTLVFLSLGGAMDSALIAGLAAFGPKYIETMYNLTAGNAAIVFGLLVVFGACTGQLLGGHLVSRFDLSVRGMTRLCFGCAGFAFLTTFVFLLPCPEEIKFAGGTVPYNGETAVGGVDSLCNKNCNCSLETYDPVCGEDTITYFSSCFAGCSSINSTDGKDCSCVKMNISSSSKERFGTVKSGECNSLPCYSFGFFVVVLFVSVGLTFLNSIPALQNTILRVFGSIPGPVLLGHVLDLSCIVWNEECDVSGSCKMYGKSLLARYMFAVAVTFKSLSTIFFILSWWTYKPVYKSDEEPIIFDNNESTIDLHVS